MALYFIAASESSDELTTSINIAFPNNFYSVAPGQWVVSSDLTTQGVVEHLGAENGAFGRVVAFPFGTYYGWHNKDLWDWMDLRKDQDF